MHNTSYRQGLIARHIIYAGKHIQTELIPYMIYDYCQPRILPDAEAANFLNSVFRVSAGTVFIKK